MAEKNPVIGIGNLLLRDEGAGVRAAELVGQASEERPGTLPPRTRVVDGGALGLDLLPMIEDACAVVLIDAVNLHGAAGDVAVLRGDALHGTLANHVSPHQVGIGDLLAAGQLAGTLTEQIALVGIQPGEIAVGLDLTAAVRAALPRAAALAVSTARELHRVVGAETGPEDVSAGNNPDMPSAMTG
ncbi:MAG: hydrogenase maturation protease [Candidatus Limnocylindrales bacterium]